MTLAAVIERDLIQSAGRLTMYTLLATGFMFPRRDRCAIISSTLLPAVSALDLGPGLDGAVESLAAGLPDDLDALRRSYMELFPPIASQDAPGYETGYRGDGVFQQTGIMADIAGFYRAHGLRAGGSERERLDHITVELEFMAVLARKEFLALRGPDGDESAAICRETAAAFLSEHLGCWAPSFGLRASSVSSSPWYTALAELLLLWVGADLEILDVEPVEIADNPVPQEPQDDGSCGPCPAPGPGGT
jgi:TorA maturation chaperone TorD